MDVSTILELALTLGKDGPKLVEKVLKRKETWRRERRSMEFKEADRKIREERISNRLLELYYPHSTLSDGLRRYVLSVDGRRVETNIAVKTSWLDWRIGLDRDHDRFKLVEGSFNRPTLSDDEVADLIADSSEREIRASNDPIFCLQHFDERFQPRSMSFSVATYFEYRLTYGKLEDELIRALIETEFQPEKSIERRKKLFPLRNRLLPDSLALTSLSHRLCAGGVNVLLALQRPYPHNDFVFFVEERSDMVASGRGTQCLIPTGFHQPLATATALQEVAVSSSVFRETYEELFGGDEVISYDGHIEPDWYFKKCPQLGWFKQKPGQFVLEAVSFGLHLKDGTYQFGVLLAVCNPDYWELYKGEIVPNYEFRHAGTRAVAVSTKDAATVTSILTNPMCANGTVFAVVEALRRLKEIEPGRVAIPQIERIVQQPE